TSGSELARARELGAADGANYRTQDWAREIVALSGGGPDVVIDSVGGETFAKCVEILKPGGRIASFAATTGAVRDFVLRNLFWKQATLLGTTMGSPREFAAMLALFGQGGLRPVVDKTFPLADAAAAHRRMEEAGQFGKIGLSTAWGASLADAIRPSHERRWDRQADTFRRLQVDRQLELGRLLDGQVAGPGTLEDLVDVYGGPPPEPGRARPIGHEASGIHEIGTRVDGREPVLLGEPCDLAPVRERDGIRPGHEQGFGAACRHRREGAIELARPGPFDGYELQVKGTGCALCLLVIEDTAPEVRIPEDGHTGEARDDLPQQLEPLPGELRGHAAVPGDVPTRAGQARD